MAVDTAMNAGRRRLMFGANVLFSIVLAVCVLIMAVYLAGRYKTQFDWTSSGVNSLSPRTVKLIKGKETYEGQIAVVMDPRADYTTEGKALQDKAVMRLYRMLARLTYIVDSLLDLQAKSKDRVTKIEPEGPLATKLQAFNDELEAFRKTMVATRKGGFLAGEEQLREKLGSLYGSVNGYEGRPTNSQLKYTEVLGRRLAEAEERFRSLLAGQLDDINAQLGQRNLDPLTRMSREEWEAKQAGS